ncbi:hypothetical protein DRO59_00155 [Candidatus Bathyarchaeota archaeon]|nr:MAG: hypothetical protein DRO59_00155 [Candidatus Bathyarchaeota archaeon]
MESKKLIISLVLLLLVIVVFFQISPPPPLTLVSISKVELQGGEEHDKKWVNGYWVIHFTLDQYEEYKGYLEIPLPANTTDTTADGKKVYTNENVLIKIRPEKAYFTRPIKKVHELITPITYRCGWNKILPAPYYDLSYETDAVYADCYVWAGDPEIHTVWTAEIYVEGALVGTAKIDTKKGATAVTVSTDKGEVIVKNLGYLQSRYIPTWQDVIAFSRKYVYRHAEAWKYIPYDNGAIMESHGTTGKLYIIKSGTSEAYSIYWYGITRWTHKNEDPEVWDTPAGWEPDDIFTYYVPVDPTIYGGWKGDDTFWDIRRKPAAPVIFPEDEDQYHMNYMCLIEYLEHKGCKNIAETMFPNAESWTLDTENMEVKVDLPWNAYYIPEGVLYVPTELADTWVYYPPKSNVKITAVGWDTGEPVRQISGTARCWIDIIQQADRESSAKITAQASTPKAKVSPAEITVTLKPGDTKRLYFDVENLGVDADTEGYVTFTAYETWTNTETSRNSNLRFKLLKYSEETTVLDVLVVDKETQSPVVGITVFVSYEGETKQGVTSTSGTCTFNLETYRGVVTISTSATPTYKSATFTRMVSGRTSITIQLEKQAAPTPPDWLIYVLIALVIASAIIVAALIIRRR